MYTKTNGRSRFTILHSLIIVLLMLALTVSPAFAAGKNCWGVVTSQRASIFHDIGQHASSQSEPRLGLGNVARLFGFDHVGELGSFLASVDGLDETHCP
jgi:hypothetical protein